MTSLFGVENRPPRIRLYQDESGRLKQDRWFYVGLLWVRRRDRPRVIQGLRHLRLQHNYASEIHFAGLPQSFDGEFGAKARVARGWLTAYLDRLASLLWFDVLCVDTHAKNYQHHRFSRDFHAYNRFVAMAICGGLSRHFPNTPRIRLSIRSDEKSRRPGGVAGDGRTTDNFEEYLARRVAEDSRQRPRLPDITLAEPVKVMNPREAYSRRDDRFDVEMLQLCDLLLGSVAAAVEMKSRRKTKTWLGCRMASAIADTRREPWKQTLGLHRRFSVGYFPDSDGRVYPNGPLAALDKTGQLPLELNAETDFEATS